MIISCINPDIDFKVLFSEALLEKMILLGKSFYPKEFGGILTGIREKDFWVIVDIEVPTKFESQKSGFIRHADFLNDWPPARTGTNFDIQLGSYNAATHPINHGFIT